MPPHLQDRFFQLGTRQAWHPPFLSSSRFGKTSNRCQVETRSQYEMRAGQWMNTYSSLSPWLEYFLLYYKKTYQSWCTKFKILVKDVKYYKLFLHDKRQHKSINKKEEFCYITNTLGEVNEYGSSPFIWKQLLNHWWQREEILHGNSYFQNRK